jgi:glycosyltransferase involved in cell wall biosynthesis
MKTISTANPPSLISLVVPVYNEDACIKLFLEKVRPIMDGFGNPWEVIFIDDGSDDETVAEIRKAKTGHGNITLISLARNFGKEAALTAGLDHAKGDAVVPIDVDLQDPPELIGDFVDLWREGYDVVYGVRIDRSSDGRIKRVAANWFYNLFNKVSRVPIPQNAGDFRLMDRRVVNQIKEFKERGRFMKALMAWPGFRSTGVPFVRPERAGGQSAWNLWRLWNFALDGITSFSTAPLRLWLYIGMVISFISFAFGAFIIVDILVTGRTVPGYASIMVAVTFLGGIQLISVGLLGEYLGRVFEEVKARPIYVIDFVED